MLTYYYIYDIVESMLMEAITLKAYRKGFLKGIMKRSLGIENTDNSISPCLVDDYRYLNKGIPNFFDYNIKDKNEAKERQDEKEKIEAEIEKDKENLARVEAYKKVKADESEKGYEKKIQSKRYANVNGWVRFRDSISVEKNLKGVKHGI